MAFKSNNYASKSSSIITSTVVFHSNSGGLSGLVESYMLQAKYSKILVNTWSQEMKVLEITQILITMQRYQNSPGPGGGFS